MTWERETWLEEYVAGERISEIARRHQVSRKTLYKWVERYQAGGLEGLTELSRAPRNHPQAVDPVWRERVRQVREQHRKWGAEKLHWLLEQRYRQAVPSVSTIGRLLLETGLSCQRRPAARAYGTGPLFPAQEANQVWAVDFKGWCRTGDGKRCEPLTISDQATRYLLCCQSLESIRTELVRPVMERVFCQYGVPERMRSDNGAPFASVGECGLTELSVWWIELGIEWERIAPGRPQQNGRHERMHRTLHEETMQPPASTWRQQQRRLAAFRREYNEERPHAALGQRPPAALYRPAQRPYRPVVAEPEYGQGWLVRKVDSGRVKWWTQRCFLSHALNGKLVGFQPFQDGLWRVWFYRHWLGVWDEKRRFLYRPHQWRPEPVPPALADCSTGSETTGRKDAAARQLPG